MAHTEKLGRNDPCHCGSGKKYKKCCLPADEQELRQKSLDAKQEAIEDDDIPDWEEDAGEDVPVSDGDEVLSDADSDSIALRSSYPQPPELPEPSPEMQAFVDDWWRQFLPVYRNSKLDAMLGMIDTVFAKHPEAVPFLSLNEECLLELQAMMVGAGRRAEWMERMLRLRSEYPLVYDQLYGYLDTTLAVSLISAGRADQVSCILDRFVKYPDHDPDCLAEMFEILLVANRQDDVFTLARSTAVPCMCSRNVWGPAPGIDWLFLEAKLPVCERRDCSDQAAADIVAACNALELPFSHEVSIDDAKTWLHNLFSSMDWESLRHKRLKKSMLSNLIGNYQVWIKDTKSLSWATSSFFSSRLWTMYAKGMSGGKRVRDPLYPDEAKVEAFICSHDSALFGVRGVRAFALLQALFWFADFLEACDQGTENDRRELRNTSLSLFKKLTSTVGSSDNSLAIFSTFPDYRFSK